jgi:hypothetical protein
VSGARDPANPGTVDDAARAVARVWRRCELRFDPHSGELAILDGKTLIAALDTLQATCARRRRPMAAAEVARRTAKLQARLDALEPYVTMQISESRGRLDLLERYLLALAGAARPGDEAAELRRRLASFKELQAGDGPL